MIRCGDIVRVVNRDTKKARLHLSIGHVGSGGWWKDSDGRRWKTVIYRLNSRRCVTMIFEKQDVVELWKKETIRRSR